ncbi:MAG: hypothetical protein CVT64_09935 [Actinobacteria bacterium HGW-Actinobacteria-4]|nr:MAG: hypothetical protein CVT64_09935 [Actinobacteria bacterium HGW-Actinobacteria-4]
MTIIDTSTIEVSASRSRSTRPSTSLFGGMGLLVRRRLWRDRGLLASSALIVMLATLLAYAGPQLVLNTIDAGAQDAVLMAGPGADVVVGFPVGNTGGDNVSSVPGTDPTEFAAHAESIASNLPRPISELVEDQSQWVLSPHITVEEVATAEEIADAVREERLPEFVPRARDEIQLGFAPGALLTVVEGRLPTDPVPGENIQQYPSRAAVDEESLPEGSVIRVNLDSTVTVTQPPVFEVAITPDVAEVLRLEIGDTARIRGNQEGDVSLTVVGIATPAEPAAPIWERFPLLAATTPDDDLATRRGTIMVSGLTLNGVSDRFETPFPGTVYFGVGAEGLTVDGSRRVSSAVGDIRSNAGALLPETTVAVSVRTGLDAALDAYPPRARAALAQMSVVVAGVVAVAAVVIALMARLLLSRRESDISLERARGASVPSMAVRLFIESALFTSAGFAAGYFAAVAIVGDIPLSNATAATVILVAALASPVLGTLMARRTWTGRREAANRQDRAKVRKARAAKRLTLESLAVVLGVLAVVTLRGRGVLQTQTAGVDPFLAAAPVLLALAVTVVVVRLYPIPMAIIQFLAKRTRGVAGVITLAKAREKIPVLPLLALTLAIAVAVSGGLLVSTVRNGQEQASWERVGGQVRIDGEVDQATAADLEAQGVTVSLAYQRELTTFILGTSYMEAQVLAVDASYATTIVAAGIDDPAELDRLADLNAQRASGAPLPVLASQEFIDVDFGGRTEIFVGRTYIPVEIVGVATVVPDGWVSGPYVIAPLEGLLDNDFEIPLAPNLAFVTGDGAEEAVAASGSIAQQHVTTRSGWLSAARDSALIGGVERMMTIAVLAVGILAAVALLVTVLQGVRDRGRALSMFRTQGMGNGYGWWLALSELAPLTVAAVAGGTGAGLIILLLLGGTLGLEVLAGGIEPPALMANPEFLGAVAAGVLVLLFVAVAAEVLAHRRNKLSEVLRYGDSR